MDQVRQICHGPSSASPSRCDPKGCDRSECLDREDCRKRAVDRKSTRLNSSHRCISYAVFCLKKKKKMVNTNSNTLPFARVQDVTEQDAAGHAIRDPMGLEHVAADVTAARHRSASCWAHPA